MTPSLSPAKKPALAMLAAIAATLAIVSFFAPWLHHAYGGNAWLVLLLAWTLLVLVALRVSARVSGLAALVIILVAAAALRLALLFEVPYLSSDMYRYIWDGRVQAAGINPYLHIPAAPELAHLRDAEIYPNINRADYAPTIYPPVAQMIFRVIAQFGDSVLAMKIGLLAFDSIAIVALIGVLRALSLPPTHVVAYAWHPLPVWEIAGHGHVDAAMVALLLAGLWLFLRAHVLPAGVVVALASLVKPTALLAMPVLWRPWDWRLPAVLAAVIAAAYVPYLSAGRRVLGFLSGYVAEEELSSGGGFRYLAMIERVSGPLPGGAALYVALAALVLGTLALQIGFRADRSAPASVRALSILLIAFLVLLTPHYPWYYLVLVPLLALGNWITPWVLTTGGFVLYDVIDGDHMPPFIWRETALHLVALVALAYDIWRARQYSTRTLELQEVRP